MPWNLISPNRVCAKINLPKFSRNTTLLALAKFFPGENFPLYGIQFLSIAIILIAQRPMHTACRYFVAQWLLIIEVSLTWYSTEHMRVVVSSH